MSTTGLVFQAAFVIFFTYVLWRIKNFLNTYKTWRQVARSKHVAILGPVHPIWGSLHLFKDFSGYFAALNDLIQNTRPKLYCMWNMFLFPRIGICHPETAQLIFKSSAPKNRAFGGAYRFLTAWLGEGLLISDGKKWELSRKLLTPGFHFQILKPYVNIYNEETDILLEKLFVHAKNRTPVDITSYVTLATLETILKTALSYDGKIQKEGLDHPYAHAVTRLSHLVMNRYQEPWFLFDFIYNRGKEGKEYMNLCEYSQNFSKKIIAERKKILQSEGLPTKRYLDFLDILLTAKDENGTGLSNDDIRAEVDTFLFEGHDTTASAINWTIYNLGKYQDEQEIVHHEVIEILGENNDVSWENLSQMPKLTAFLKESMRMFAPVPVVGRVLKTPLQFGECVIPEGTHIEVNMHMIHHHPDVWPDHEVFRPTRFSDDRIANRHPYSYVPFAAGSRFKVALVENFEYDTVPEVVMRAKNGIMVHLANRK